MISRGRVHVAVVFVAAVGVAFLVGRYQGVVVRRVAVGGPPRPSLGSRFPPDPLMAEFRDRWIG